MSRISEAILNGDICMSCGNWFADDGNGNPRMCRACAKEHNIQEPVATRWSFGNFLGWLLHLPWKVSVQDKRRADARPGNGRSVLRR